MTRRAAALALAVLTVFCAGVRGGNAAEAKLDEPFEMKPGEKVSLASGELVLTFVAVTQDSRCPKGEQCIAAGKAVVKFEAAPAKGEAVTFELETGASASEASETDVAGFRISLLDLLPYPVSGRPRISQDSLSKLTVHRL